MWKPLTLALAKTKKSSKQNFNTEEVIGVGKKFHHNFKQINSARKQYKYFMYMYYVSWFD